MLLLYMDRMIAASRNVLITSLLCQGLAKYTMTGIHCSLGHLNFGTFSMYSFNHLVKFMDFLGKQSIFS